MSTIYAQSIADNIKLTIGEGHTNRKGGHAGVIPVLEQPVFGIYTQLIPGRRVEVVHPDRLCGPGYNAIPFCQDPSRKDQDEAGT